MGNSADNWGALCTTSAGGGAWRNEALQVVGAWQDSAYLACCRQRAAELRVMGRCVTPLIEPDNSHIRPVVACQCGSAGLASSRDTWDALRRTKRLRGARLAGGWGAA